MKIKLVLFLAGIVPFVLGMSLYAYSQEFNAEQPETARSSEDSPAGNYEEVNTSSDESSSQFGGPNSVGATLKRDETDKPSIIKYDPFKSLLTPYFNLQKRIKNKYGLAFSFDYHALIQTATESLGDKTAASGVVRFFGKWELVGRDSGNTGSFVFKVENRHRLGTDIAPVALGSEIGYAGLTTTTFSDRGWELTNLFWEQLLFGGRLEFIAGVVDTTDYVDVYSMADPWTGFDNLVFQNNPTIPLPSQGVGVAGGLLITNNIYILTGFADTNGDPTDPWESVNTFFDQSEYFTHIELGWISSLENKFTDNVHVTAWYADKREKEDVPNGWGIAASFNRLFADRWEPFVRAGYADDGGALLEKDISVGLGYYTQEKSGLIALGLSWGEPSEENFGVGLEDQYTAELFYRMQILQSLTVTPDVQLLIDPALNPQEDVIAVFGVRGRLAF